MFRPHMAVIRSPPLRFRYINYETLREKKTDGGHMRPKHVLLQILEYTSFI